MFFLFRALLMKPYKSLCVFTVLGFDTYLTEVIHDKNESRYRKSVIQRVSD